MFNINADEWIRTQVVWFWYYRDYLWDAPIWYSFAKSSYFFFLTIFTLKVGGPKYVTLLFISHDELVFVC